jgi:hypothetical protein
MLTGIAMVPAPLRPLILQSTNDENKVFSASASVG